MALYESWLLAHKKNLTRILQSLAASYVGYSLYNKFEFTGDRRHMVSCRNHVAHFQWVFPTSRGLFSLLLGGLNTPASREQPGERPTFRMTLLRDDSVTKYRCQAFSPGTRPSLFCWNFPFVLCVVMHCGATMYPKLAVLSQSRHRSLVLGLEYARRSLQTCSGAFL